MVASTIDGTVEEAVLKRSRAGVSIFDSLTFRLDDGSSRTIKKAVVKDEVARELVAGRHGRFYLFTTFDLKGVHGVRLDDGREVYDFPANNAKIFLILGLVNLAWVVLKLSTDGSLPLLGVGLMILGTVGYILTRKGQREAQQQFEADSGYARVSSPATAQPVTDI